MTNLHYLHLVPDQSLPPVGEPILSRVVVIIEAPVSEAWQELVSDWIVAYGCRYMMAWGPNCSSWDDSADRAARMRNGLAEIPDDRFVLTTWHNDQSLEDALFYCEYNALFSYNDAELTHALMLHIAHHADENRMRAAYARMLAAQQ